VDARQHRAALAALEIIEWVPCSGGVAVSIPEPALQQIEKGNPVHESRPAPETLDQRETSIEQLGWDALRARVVACTACELCRTRTQTVFGVGDPGARLLIVGEAPGAEEDRQGEPFVGPAGRLLDEMLRAIGLNREQVYICNILKCRPPNNADPTPAQAAACRPFIARQIALINPQLILAVGRVAAQNLLQVTTPLNRLRGQIHHCNTVDSGASLPVWVTYHPAYLLRSPQEKARAWEDLKMVRGLLERSPS
jgi:DNA polymerase